MNNNYEMEILVGEDTEIVDVNNSEVQETESKKSVLATGALVLGVATVAFVSYKASKKLGYKLAKRFVEKCEQEFEEELNETIEDEAEETIE